MPWLVAAARAPAGRTTSANAIGTALAAPKPTPGRVSRSFRGGGPVRLPGKAYRCPARSLPFPEMELAARWPIGPSLNLENADRSPTSGPPSPRFRDTATTSAPCRTPAKDQQYRRTASPGPRSNRHVLARPKHRRYCQKPGDAPTQLPDCATTFRICLTPTANHPNSLRHPSQPDRQPPRQPSAPEPTRLPTTATTFGTRPSPTAPIFGLRPSPTANHCN